MRPDVLDAVKELSLADPKTLSQKTLKLFEEGGELAKAVLPYESAAGTLHRVVNKAKLLEEAADVMLVALSIAYELGFDNDAITSAMERKALYWAEIQKNEAGVNPHKIPHEIHVTVETAEVDTFRADCNAIGVKPVFLALHTKSTTPIRDVMTSQVVIGTTTAAFDAMHATENALKSKGYNVVRSKIEAAPWHPCAPTVTNRLKHAPYNYFESHIEVYVNDGPNSLCSMRELKNCLVDSDAHLSNNYFKSTDTVKTVMVTLRRYTGTYERFMFELEQLKERISGGGFTFNPKDIVEYSIFDSKTSHDSVWMDE